MYNPKQWYEVLYENFQDYDQEPYTLNTKMEVDFLDKEISRRLNGEVGVLDVGCGPGRHSLELARRGYRVTGIDLSEEFIATARDKAEEENLKADFRQADARRLDFYQQYEMVIMLCEGGFSLMETDEMDRMILQGIYRALKPGGWLYLTAPSAVHMLANLAANPGFDPVTFRERFSLRLENQHGAEQELDCSQRYYTFPELKYSLESLGFEDAAFFGVSDAGYDRDTILSPDHFELGISARK
ncbi:MAG: class I SAM-dependent methyltransferase [Anaerolineales bacterium]|nr:class I SAM-dependent methyltransferase [Anaerolineales bacterium]